MGLESFWQPWAYLPTTETVKPHWMGAWLKSHDVGSLRNLRVIWVFNGSKHTIRLVWDAQLSIVSKIT